MHNWRKLLEAASQSRSLPFQKLQLLDNGAEIILANGRRQKFSIERETSFYRLTSVVMGSKRVEAYGIAETLNLAWQRNHEVAVVAFNVDRQGRLIGEIQLLADTLEADEAVFYIQQLMEECDRLEYLLVGRDEQ